MSMQTTSKLTWIGHSTALIEADGMSILTDPVPVYATMVTGATGLLVGALLARQVARDKIAMARRLHKLAVQ